jgi:hypothetical protein
MQASHLDKRGSEGQLACYEEGLKYVSKKVSQRIGGDYIEQLGDRHSQKVTP